MKAHSHATHKTILTLGGSLPGVRQPLFALERQAHHLAQDHQADLNSVHYLEGLGWRLIGSEFSVSQMHEGETQPLTASSGSLMIAPGHVEFPARGAESLPGIGGGSSGSRVFQKRIPAGAAWSQRLESDQTDLPSPAPEDDLHPMDRIAKTTASFGTGESRHFRFHLPGGSLSSSATAATLYFWDAPGGPSSGEGHGNGHYALKLGGSGQAKLYESNGAGGWTRRSEFRWAASTMVSGATHEVHIASGSSMGRPLILFHFDSISHDERKEGSGGGFAVFAKAGRAVSEQGVRDRRSWTYHPPQPEPRTPSSGPVRLDVRRDLRPLLQIFQTVYPASGSLLESPFSFDFIPAPGEPIKAEWYGAMPEGTSLELTLEDADTGAELPDRTLILSDEKGGVVQCSLPQGVRRIRARVAFHASPDRRRTPTLTSLRFFRSASLFESGMEEVRIGGEDRSEPALLTRAVRLIEEVQEGEEKGLKITLAAQKGSEDLPLGAGTALSLHLKQDEAETCLFRGRIEAAFGRGVRGGWMTWEIYARSEEERLKLSRPPRRFSWWDIEADLPMKVTDFVRILLSSIWPSEMLAIPDREERLPSGAEGAWLPEPEADLFSLMKRLSEVLLGARLMFDPSLGARGQWKLTALMDSESPVRAKLRKQHSALKPLHWEDHVEGLPAVVMIQEGFEEWTAPPLASQVQVEGRALGQNCLIAQALVNIRAAPLFALPTSHPKAAVPGSADWLGTQRVLTYRDDSLNTQLDVDKMAVKLFDSCTKGHKMRRVRVPFILVSDSGRQRPLGEGDRLEVEAGSGEWEVWRVSRADHRWSMNALKWTDLELVKGDRLPSLKSAGFKGWLNKGVRTLFGLGDLAELSLSGSRLAAQQSGHWTVLPVLASSTIQDLDPESESFGEITLG